jgi:hypothetical protein
MTCEKQPEAWRGPNGEMRNRPPTLTPLQLYKRSHCEHCTWYEVCNPEQRLACILSAIADDLKLLRRTTQERTAHISW